MAMSVIIPKCGHFVENAQIAENIAGLLHSLSSNPGIA